MLMKKKNYRVRVEPLKMNLIPSSNFCIGGKSYLFDVTTDTNVIRIQTEKIHCPFKKRVRIRCRTRGCPKMWYPTVKSTL